MGSNGPTLEAIIDSGEAQSSAFQVFKKVAKNAKDLGLFPRSMAEILSDFFFIGFTRKQLICNKLEIKLHVI